MTTAAPIAPNHKDLRMFCESCKDVRDDEDANYCKKCGTKLLSINELTIPRETLSKDYLIQFLKHTLGYVLVEDLKGGWIGAGPSQEHR